MTTAYDVACYIASRQSFSGEAQMHKLLYYVQAWSLAWDGVPLFDEQIEAWQMGPVVRSMRYVQPPADASRLGPEARTTVDAVLSCYGSMTGGQLIELTHAEEPWKAAWGDRPAHARGNDPISHEMMRRTYTDQSRRGDGPRRVAGPGDADLASVLARSGAAAQRWERTLDLLAQ